MEERRALHFSLKIDDRHEIIKFYKCVLGMKILRHEEFNESCKASCQGSGGSDKWSKTMVGYGPEDNYFAMELIFNYDVHEYKHGNDFMGIAIQSSQAMINARSENWPIHSGDDESPFVYGPGGYRFNLVDEQQPVDTDPVKKVILVCSDLKRSLKFWVDLLEMKTFEQTESIALLGYAENQVKLELKDIGENVDHGTANGRIAFACPTAHLSAIEKCVTEADLGCVATPLTSLHTPGKETVKVVVLNDPDGHEICFVGDESFRKLSCVDPEAERLLSEATSHDEKERGKGFIKVPLKYCGPV